MPIPHPNPNEKQSSYISRCVSFIFSEGTLNGKKISRDNPADRKQAIAVCYSTWRSSKKSEDEEVIIHGGLRDTNGYFCRLESSSFRHYYDINDLISKDKAVAEAQNEWFKLQVNILSKDIEVKQEEPGGDGRDEPVDGDTDTRPPSDEENKRDEFINACISKKVGQGISESTAREQCIQEWDAKNKSIDYIVPKSKDELREGNIIKFGGKVGKIVKILEK